LSDDGAVDIADLIARRANAACRLRQQQRRVGTLKRRIGIGEVAPDVAQRRGAEQRVGDGVQQRVGVGMPEQAVRVRDRHAPQY
jgi:hypothetical protein